MKETEEIKEKLWNRNFIIMMLGTVISAIGGVGLNLALSVTVYDNTASTFLSGAYSAVVMIPSVLLPLLIGPLVDRYSRKKIIVYSDFLMGGIFALFALLTWDGYFNYFAYILMGLIISINAVIYQLAYDSLFPNLIPKHAYQQGYAIATLIYPLTSVVVLPLATAVYHHFGVTWLFLLEAALLVLAAGFERLIQVQETFVRKMTFKLTEYQADIKAGMTYLRQEKGIWSIYLFFMVMMFSDGVSVLIYPFFEQHAVLNVVNYSLLLSVQSAGYLFGGIFHYWVKLPTDKRYLISLVVYSLFALLGGTFFWMPFLLMLLSKFVLGFGGMNSANIRITSINHYIQDEMRGRIHSVYQVMISVSMISGKLVAGWLAEFLPYPAVGLLYGIFILMGIGFCILPQGQAVKVLYNRAV